MSHPRVLVLTGTPGAGWPTPRTAPSSRTWSFLRKRKQTA